MVSGCSLEPEPPARTMPRLGDFDTLIAEYLNEQQTTLQSTIRLEATALADKSVEQASAHHAEMVEARLPEKRIEAELL
jgi:hypothetical protein